MILVSSEKGLCDVLLVINSNLGHHRYGDTATYRMTNANFTCPPHVFNPKFKDVRVEGIRSLKFCVRRAETLRSLIV